MINYEESTGVGSAFPETVPVSALEYRTLVEDAEKGRVMADGILSAFTYDGISRYGREIRINDDAILAVFKAVYPDDYNFWLEDQKKRTEEERKKVAEENDIL